MAAGDLGPLDLYALDSRRRRVDDTYGLGTAQNAYQRATEGNQYGLDTADLRKQLIRQREAFPYQYGGRGIENSGIYQHGLSNLLGDQQSIEQRLLAQHADRLAGFTLGQNQLDSIYQSAQADIAAEADARRKAAAAAILGYG